MSYFFRSLRLAFLGCGNIAQNMIEGYLKHSPISPENILASGRNLQKTKRICDKFKIQMIADNEELLEKASVIFICLKPQDLEEALESLSHHWLPHHTVLSLAAGSSFSNLKKWGINCKRLVRLMPSTSVSVGKGLLPFCSMSQKASLNSFVEELLKPLGQVITLDHEELLVPATVAGASGLAFVLELMIYWMEWLEEQGVPLEHAKTFTIQTFLGAAYISQIKNKKSLLELQKEGKKRQTITDFLNSNPIKLKNSFS